MFLFILYLVFGHVSGAFIIRNELERYTRLATTTDGLPCLGGCSPATKDCVANWLWNKKPCQLGNEPAPIYFTSQYRDQNSKICLSNCGKFGHLYDWCVTGPNNKWDYCSSQVRGAVSSTSRNFVDAYTKDSQLCLSACNKSSDKKGYRCSLRSIFWNYCAKQAINRVPTLPPDYFIGGSNKQNCEAFLTNLISVGFKANVSFFNTDYAADGYVSEIADAVEAAVKLTPETGVYKNKGETTSAIASYTMVNVILANGSAVLVPAVIRASVTNNTIRQNQPLIDLRMMVERNPFGRNRRQVEYDADRDFNWRIIGYELGGSDEDYNFVRQTPNLYESWLQLQRAIGKWCDDTGGSVDMTVVIFYPDVHSTMPKALGVVMSFNNPNGVLFVTCKDTIYWNR